MLPYLRNLSSKNRNHHNDRHLACYLTFVAGAANAGGYMAIRQYTSHMSGIISAMADNLVLADWPIVASGFAAVFSFIAGSAVCAILVNWARRQNLHAQYALPLFLEGILLITFGIMGERLQTGFWFFTSFTIMLLCFIMGLQNATVTKLSNSRIRTTHMTGLVTDIGIELGKLLYWNNPQKTLSQKPVVADHEKLRLLSTLVTLFFIGGIVGAIGFQKIGFTAAIFLGVLVLFLSLIPVVDDLLGKVDITP